MGKIEQIENGHVRCQGRTLTGTYVVGFEYA